MWSIIFTLIGTLIGAGFVSGKEIYIFFYRSDLLGFLGLLISCIIIGFVVYKVFIIIHREQIVNYDQLLMYIFKNKKQKNLIKKIIHLYLLISFCIMVSGFADFIKQEFFVSKIISYLFLLLFCIYIFFKDIEGIAKVNTIIIPICVIFIIFLIINKVNISFVFSDGYTNYVGSFFKLIIMAILYANYNLLTIIPLLIEVNKMIKDRGDSRKKKIKGISFIFSLIAFVLSSVILISLMYAEYIGQVSILNMQMPMIEIVEIFNPFFKYIYSMIICFAIITTAISSGYNYLKNGGKKIYLILISFVFIQFDFSNLISFFYPIFGVIGIVQNIKLIKK